MADKNKEAQELKGILGEVNAVLKEMEIRNKAINDGFASTKDSLSSIVDIASQYNSHQSRSKELSSDQLKDLSKKLKDEKEILKLSQESLAQQLQRNRTERDSLTQQYKNLKNQSATKKLSGDQIKQLEKLKTSHQSITQTIDQQNIALDQSRDVLNDIDGSIGDIEKGFDKAAKTAKRAEFGKKLSAGLDKISTPIDDLLNPMALFNKLIGFTINTVLEFDQRLGDTAKSMNLTYKEAEDSNRAMIKFAKSAGDAYLNSKDLNKTVVDLNKNLGTSIKFEQLTGALKEDVALMSKLENVAGLTAEETQGILQYTLATGQSATKATKDLMANYRVAGLKRGVVLNEKDALKEISKLSNAIKLSTAGGATGLAKAAAAAKALGSDLGKVDDIASSILNFEESIEAELSAELLTGKDLNLEKAREAALNNDLATLSDEIKKNVGDSAKFAEMNRIQQDAIAKSVGMTREELATTLTNQEALKNVGASSIEQAQEQYNLAVKEGREKEFLNQLGNEALEKQFKQQSSQEELVSLQKQSADKIIDTIKGFDEWKTRLKEIYKNFESIVEKVGGFKTLIAAIGAIMTFKLVSSLGRAVVLGATQLATAIAYTREIRKQQSLKTGEISKEVALTAAKVAGAEASTLGAATVPIIAGIGAIMAVVAGLTMMNDGIISPSSGGSGYGDRVMYGPEGAISFNNKDTIVAGTDLFKANDMVSSPKGTVQVASNNNSSKEIAELRSAIIALAARPVDVSIDGTKVIEATTGMNPNTQGLESAKNSFKMQ
jgi:hypothetical protein